MPRSRETLSSRTECRHRSTLPCDLSRLSDDACVAANLEALADLVDDLFATHGTLAVAGASSRPISSASAGSRGCVHAGWLTERDHRFYDDRCWKSVAAAGVEGPFQGVPASVVKNS